MVDDGSFMITERRKPPRELFRVHRTRRVPLWMRRASGVGHRASGDLATVGLVVVLLAPPSDSWWLGLARRVPFQLGLLGLVVAAVARRTITIDGTGCGAAAAA